MLRSSALVIFVMTIGLADAAEAPMRGAPEAAEPPRSGACQTPSSAAQDTVVLLATNARLQKSRPLEEEDVDMQASATSSQQTDEEGVRIDEETSQQSGMEETEESEADEGPQGKAHGIGSFLQSLADDMLFLRETVAKLDAENRVMKRKIALLLSRDPQGESAPPVPPANASGDAVEEVEALQRVMAEHSTERSQRALLTQRATSATRVFGCSTHEKPGFEVSSTKLYITAGKHNCCLKVSIFGAKINECFGLDLKIINTETPEPLKTAIGIAEDMGNCDGEPFLKCMGSKLIAAVPPFSIFSHMANMLKAFIAGFGKVAEIFGKAAFNGQGSLVQAAATSEFHKDGSRKLHHASRNMAIHTFQRAWQPSDNEDAADGDASVLQTKDRLETQGIPRVEKTSYEYSGLLSASTSNGPAYTHSLITQFAGKEHDTSSCLAFAPRTRSGDNIDGVRKVGLRDWKVVKTNSKYQGQFIQLEPWAVPCTNDWMKNNPGEWEGFSFYQTELPIEKCIDVTFTFAVNPVIAFVGGLELEMMPAPLIGVTATICWPDKLSAGLQLSMLQFSLVIANVPMLLHSIRLARRFGPQTPFTAANNALKTVTSPSVIRNFGLNIPDGMDDNIFAKFSRERLLQTGESSAPAEGSPGASPAPLESGSMVATRENLEFSTLGYSAERGLHLMRREAGDQAAAALRGLLYMQSVTTLAGCPRSGISMFPEECTDKISAQVSVRCCRDDGTAVPMEEEYGCHESKTYEDAEAICRNNDLRLCTAQEIYTNQHCSQGCGFDSHRIWTSTPCSTTTWTATAITLFSLSSEEILSIGNFVGSDLFGFKLEFQIVDGKLRLNFETKFGPFEFEHPIDLIDMIGTMDSLLAAIPQISSATASEAKNLLTADLQAEPSVAFDVSTCESVGVSISDAPEIDTGVGMLFVSEVTFSKSGRIASIEAWSQLADSDFVVLILRHTGPGIEALQYEKVGSIEMPLNAGANHYFSDGPNVQEGDVLGWYSPAQQPIKFTNGGNIIVRRVYGKTAAATTLDMSGHENGWTRSYALSVKLCEES